MIRSGGEVARLIGELSRVDPIRRDAAVARLRIIGSRALDALLTLARSRSPIHASVAALKALEGFDDPRVIDAALPLLTDPDPQLAAAALGVLRPWVTREPGTRVLEALTTTALNPGADAAIRLAALDAVAQLPRDVVRPLFEVATERDTPVSPPAAGNQADDPLTILAWLAEHPTAPLSEIHRLIERVRELEQREPSTTRRDQWTRARGAAHARLAARASTVAVYDLRETFATADRPLPVDFVTAVAAIGDASCLEPMARAWAAVPSETWWRDRLAEAAADIMRREKLTGRNAVVKRVRAGWAGFI